MTDIERILAFLEKYPGILFTIAGLLITGFLVIVAFAIISWKTGRAFSTPLFRFGTRLRAVRPPTEKEAREVGRDLEEYRQKEGIRGHLPEPHLEPIPDHTIELFRLKLAIDRQIRHIATRINGVLGDSIADFDRFYERVRMNGMVRPEILEEIGTFDGLSMEALRGDPIDEEWFQTASELGAKILRDLSTPD